MSPSSLTQRFTRRMLLAALICFATLAQAASAPHYSISSWGTEQGLPSNAVLDIRQTSDGYLWIASYQGLVRFDGVSFRIFTEDDIGNLNRASFWAIAQDASGALWAGTEASGLVRHLNGHWLVYRTADGLPTDKLTEVISDAAGAIWIGSRQGVSRIVNGRVEALPAPVGGKHPSVSTLAAAPDGSIWIGTAAEGLLHYRAGRYTRFGTAEGLRDLRITAIYVGNSGDVLVGAYGAGVTRIRNGVATQLATCGATPRRVNEIYEDPRGTLWIGADNGLFRMEGEKAIPVTLADGSAIAQVEAIRPDRDGNLWIGSRQSGLYRLRESTFQTIAPPGNDPATLVYAVVGDGSGGLWIATEGGAVHRSATRSDRFHAANGALNDDVARDIIRDEEGVVWVATNGGLTRIHNNRTRTFTTSDGLADLRCRVLLEDKTGALWVGTNNGLSRYQDGQFRTFGAADGLTDGYILSLFEDSKGRVWVGTQSEGLFALVNGRFAPGPPELAKEPIFRMTEDVDGGLWIGTARGLVHLHDNKATRFTVRDGLPGNAVFQAVDDGRGNLWLTGSWGFARVPRKSLDDVNEGREKVLVARQFGRGDGLIAREASSISRAWTSPDGTLYFPTPAGLAVVKAATVETNATPPRAYLEQVVADDRILAPHISLEFAPGTRKLEFHFSAPTFVAPSQLRFRYRLDGFDEDWIDGGTRRAAFYTNLPHGTYTFRVLARNEDGVWSEHPAMVTVRLKAHFWETWWFIALASATLIAVLLFAYRVRVRAMALAHEKDTARAMSLRDDLTDLYNRRGLLALAEQQVRMAERTHQSFDLIFIDMDGLKEINDTFGHAEGDRALNDAANVLRATFRDSDVVARLGGDEFAALVFTEKNVGDSIAVCERLYSAVDRFNTEEGRVYKLSVSAGVSRFDPAHPKSIEELLTHADRSMYSRKKEKREKVP